MRSWVPRIFCLLVLAGAPLARTQTLSHVYRCIGAHGEPVFSGEPCGTPAPIAGQKSIAQGGGLGGVCTGSPQELRQVIASAFASRDVNRLAGLILWRGMDRSSARAALRSLAAWLTQPLTGIAIAYPARPPPTDDEPSSMPAAVSPTSASSAAEQSPSGFKISTGGSDGGTRDFGVTQSGNCWWLTF